MKNIYNLLLLSLLFGCTDEYDNVDLNQPVKLSLSIQEEEDPTTRTELGKDNITTSWKDGDKIGLWSEDLLDSKEKELNNKELTIHVKNNISSINEIFSWKVNEYGDAKIYGFYPYNSKITQFNGNINNISVPSEQFQKDENDKSSLPNLDFLYSYFSEKKVSVPNLAFKHVFNLFEFQVKGEYKLKAIELQTVMDDYLAFDNASFSCQDNKIINRNEGDVQGKKDKLTLTIQKEGGVQLEKDSCKSFFAIVGGRMEYVLDVALKFEKPAGFKTTDANKYLDTTTDKDFIYYRFKLNALDISNGGSKYTVSINGKDDPTVTSKSFDYIYISNFKTGTLEERLKNEKINAFNYKVLSVSGDALNEKDFNSLKTVYDLHTFHIKNTQTKVIPPNAFKNYKESLNKVTLPETITTIGDNAFAGCKALSFTDLPQKIENIGENVFTNVRFGNVTIPASIKKIKRFAFDNITFSSTGYLRINGNPEIKCNEDEWILYADNLFNDLTFNNTVNLDDKFFRTKYNEGENPMIFTNIFFKENVKSLPKFCDLSSKNTNAVGTFHFFKDLNLEEKNNNYNYLSDYATIFLHDNVKVRNNSFKEFIKNNNKEISVYCSDNVNFEENSLKDSNVSKIEVVNGTKSLAPDFLSKKSGVSDSIFIKIHHDVSTLTVNDKMFEDVHMFDSKVYVIHSGEKFKPISHIKFQTLQIENQNLTEATASIFRGTLFREIILPYKTETKLVTTTGGSKYETATKAAIKTIKDYAFADCPHLNLIIGLENVEILESNIFTNTPYYNNLTLSNLRYAYGNALKDSHITELNLKNSPLDYYDGLGKYAFAGAKKLRVVNFTNTKLKAIPAYCFDGDELLTFCIFNDVDEAKSQSRYNLPIINSSIKSIGNWAFNDCKSLCINIPNSVESLGNSCFANCYNLIIYLRGSGLRTIGTDCFNSSYNLSYINIPPYVNSIGRAAFKTRNINHTLEVDFNWNPIKRANATQTNILEYDESVWPLGNLIIHIPGDDDHKNRDTDLIKEYGKKGYGSKRSMPKTTYNEKIKAETFDLQEKEATYIKSFYTETYRNVIINGDGSLVAKRPDGKYYYARIERWDLGQYFGSLGLTSSQLISFTNLASDILFDNPRLYGRFIDTREFSDLIRNHAKTLGIPSKSFIFLDEDIANQIIKLCRHIDINLNKIYKRNEQNIPDLGGPLLGVPPIVLYYPVLGYKIVSNDQLTNTTKNDAKLNTYIPSLITNKQGEYTVNYYKYTKPNSNEVELSDSSIPDVPVSKRNAALVGTLTEPNKTIPIILGSAGGVIGAVGITVFAGAVISALTTTFAVGWVPVTVMATYAFLFHPAEAVSMAAYAAAEAAFEAAGSQISAMAMGTISTLSFAITVATAVVIVVAIALIIISIILILLSIFLHPSDFVYASAVFKTTDKYVYNLGGDKLLTPSDFPDTKSYKEPTDKFLPAFELGSEAHKKVLDDMQHYDEYLERLNKMGKQLNYDEKGNEIVVPLRPAD